MWWGRGFRWRFWATGVPGYERYYGWNCWRFPWLPRGWWTGMYGPIDWAQTNPTILPVQKEEELAQLKSYEEELKAELEWIKNEIENIQRRINELEAKK